MRPLLLAVAAAAAGCMASAPPAMVESSGDSCIDDFVARGELPFAQGVEASRPVAVGATRVRLFEVAYGRANDCEAGCFFSHAIGLERGACDKIGWILVDDYERLGARRFPPYLLDESDAILLAPATWAALHAALGNQYENDFLRWLERHPEAAPDLAARVAAEKQSLRRQRGY